ncbi:hypothetical protein QZH41_007288 [Actinostola sp. cb2023]|nr:hypothetical protein QZH41_007288 [Actinostola sp. cb2023]
MKAIDSDSGRPNGIIDIDLSSKTQEEKPKKLPIFLQSSEKPKETTEVPGVSHDPEKRKSGSSTSVRSKLSQNSSYDFKETVKNLHHGLPAHPSDQHLRGRRNSQDDELSFGSYKPTVGQREAANKKPEILGSYNPSFVEPKKEEHGDSGLDFSKKQGRNTSNDLVFGSYQPTFGGSSKSSNISKDTDNIGGLDFSSRRNDGRRGRQNQSNSVFGEDIFNNNDKSKTTPLFDDASLSSSTKTKDKNYPWEKTVNASVDIDDDSLLPRRPKLNQGLNQGHKQTVPAIGNILNGTLDDDIEEVTL